MYMVTIKTQSYKQNLFWEVSHDRPTFCNFPQEQESEYGEEKLLGGGVSDVELEPLEHVVVKVSLNQEHLGPQTF